MKRACAIVLMLTVTVATTAGARERQPARGGSTDADTWRAFARHPPIGSVVTVRTKTGERLRAILFVVDDTGITVKPKTRFPEPAQHLSFDRLEDVQLEQGGVRFSKYAATGAAVGAGLFVILLAGAR